MKAGKLYEKEKAGKKEQEDESTKNYWLNILGENASLVDTIYVQQVLIFITQFQKKKNLL